MQEVAFGEEVVDLVGDLGAACARLQEAHAIFMGIHIGLPDAQAVRIDGFDKERAFQRRVIARDHRECVQRQDIAALQRAGGDGVVGAVGVDAGLEPDPCVAQFAVGEAAGNFQLHRVASGHGHVDLSGACADRIADGIAAHVCGGGTGADEVEFGGRFVHPLRHGGGRDVGGA